MLAARRLRSFEFGFAPFEKLRYLGIGVLSEYESILKILAIYPKFFILQSTSFLTFTSRFLRSRLRRRLIKHRQPHHPPDNRGRDRQTQKTQKPASQKGRLVHANFHGCNSYFPACFSTLSAASFSSLLSMVILTPSLRTY